MTDSKPDVTMHRSDPEVQAVLKEFAAMLERCEESQTNQGLVLSIIAVETLTLFMDCMYSNYGIDGAMDRMTRLMENAIHNSDIPVGASMRHERIPKPTDTVQ